MDTRSKGIKLLSADGEKGGNSSRDRQPGQVQARCCPGFGQYVFQREFRGSNCGRRSSMGAAPLSGSITQICGHHFSHLSKRVPQRPDKMKFSGMLLRLKNRMAMFHYFSDQSLSFFMAARRSFDPDPHREMVFIACVKETSNGCTRSDVRM
jgi:hypothetical protein